MLLVLRELICGSTRFNDLRRGVPLMSSSLLLAAAQVSGVESVVERRPAASGQRLWVSPDRCRPRARAADHDDGRAAGARAGRSSRLEPKDLDVTLLMWDMHRTVRPERSPQQRVVVAFEFAGVPQSKRRWWLVSEGDAADLCMTDPGVRGRSVPLFTDLRTMTAIWVGDLTLEAALASGALEAHGPPHLCGRLKDWLGLSAFAAIESRRQTHVCRLIAQASR